MLNERDFPPFSNIRQNMLTLVCQPILSNVSESRLYQRKPASNVKLVSIHVSPVYANSITSLQKCSTNEFFNLGTISSCHYSQHTILHRNLVCLAITNLKCRNYNSFYKFLLLLSGDVSLNPGPVQISPPVNINFWEPFNKKDLHFLHININSLLPKIDELKCIANKTKATAIGITE